METILRLKGLCFSLKEIAEYLSVLRFLLMMEQIGRQFADGIPPFKSIPSNEQFPQPAFAVTQEVVGIKPEVKSVVVDNLCRSHDDSVCIRHFPQGYHGLMLGLHHIRRKVEVADADYQSDDE